MWLLALALTLSALCVWASVWRLGQVRRAFPRESAALGRELSRLPEHDLPKLAEALPAASAERALVEALTESSVGPARIALVNEQLGDIAAALDRGRGVPRAAGRVALGGGLGLGVWRVASTVASADGGDAALAGAAFGIGLVAAGVCLALGRRADALAGDAREQWDTLGRIIARRFVPDA